MINHGLPATAVMSQRLSAHMHVQNSAQTQLSHKTGHARLDSTHRISTQDFSQVGSSFLFNFKMVKQIHVAHEPCQRPTDPTQPASQFALQDNKRNTCGENFHLG